MSLNRLLSTMGIFRTLLTGVIAICGLLFTGTAYAVDCAQWLAVKEWRADMTISGQGQRQSTSSKWEYQSKAKVTYKLVTTSSSCVNGVLTLGAAADANGSVQLELLDRVTTTIIYRTISHGGNIPSFWAGASNQGVLIISSGNYSIFRNVGMTDDCKLVQWNGSGYTTETTPCIWDKYFVVNSDKTWPLPATGLVLKNTVNYTTPPGGDFEGDINWTISWTIYPAKLEPKDPCQTPGSTICIEPQSLAETVTLAGTPFSLYYQSERVPGRKGATWNAQKQALGGWTLNVHHAYDPANNALYLGDGTRRGIDALGAVSPVGGKYRIPAEDGSEIHEFNTGGYHLRTLDALTNAVRYAFTYTQGRLTAITDRDGNITRIERDATGAPTVIVGPFGHRTTLAASAGYLSAITDPAGARHVIQYGSGGLLTTFTNPLGRSRHYTYNSVGQLLTATDPAGGVKRLTRTNTTQGHKVSLATPLGRTSTYMIEQLPGEQEQRTVTGTDGLASRATRTQNGNTTNTFPDGSRYSQVAVEDPRWGRPVRLPQRQTTILPSGLTSTTTSTRQVKLANLADPLSLVSQTDKQTVNGRTYTNVYTASNRTLTATTPQKRWAKTTLDSRGRVIRAESAGLLPFAFTYTANGQLASVTQGGRTYTFGYQNGQLVRLTDPLGRAVSFQHDAVGRVIKQTLADGRAINYGYDASGNLTALTPPGRPPHRFSYTSVDELNAYDPPDTPSAGASTVYAYNADRQLARVTRPDGKTLTLAYDTAGRLSTQTWPGGSLNFGYHTTTGQLNRIAVPGSQLSYTHDGDLLRDSAWAGAVTGMVRRGYDANLRLASLAVNGSPIALAYDTDSLLTAAGALTLRRDALSGRLTGTTLGAVSEAFTYNGFGEVTAYQASRSGAALFAAQYARDALGRITRQSETLAGKTTSYDYAYDPAGRLQSARVNGALLAAYSYDANGNRLAVSGSQGAAQGVYDAQDRLLRYTVGGAPITYGYTTHGELQSKTAGAQKTTYTYDVLGNLLQVKLPNGATISYVVDGQNRRIGKKVNGQLVQGFLYQDALRPIAELNGANQVVSRFVYASRDNVPDYLIRNGVTYRIVADHLGSPRLVVNVATGQIMQRLDYGPFGEVLSDSNPGFQPFGFAGGLYDKDTKLVRFGARDYDAQIGRWTVKDPILFVGGDTNLYGYGLNNPVNVSDFSGLQVNWPEEPGDKPVKVKEWFDKLKDGDPPGASQEYGDIIDEVKDTAKEGTVPFFDKLKELWQEACNALGGNPKDVQRADSKKKKPTPPRLQPYKGGNP